MDNKIAIYLTEQEEKDFLEWRKYQKDKEKTLILSQNWKQLIEFAQDIQYGSATITFKDGLPVRVNKSVKQIVFGIKI